MMKRVVAALAAVLILVALVGVTVLVGTAIPAVAAAMAKFLEVMGAALGA